MKKGKFETKGAARKVSKKLVSLILALVLCIGGVVGGTLAWLTAETEAVTNTFAPSDINITLTEDTKKHDTETDYTFKMVPGDTFTKDPKVTVEAGSEACWLFVTVEEVGANVTPEGEAMPQILAFGDFLTYEIAEGWTKLEDGVYYRKVEASTDDQPFYVLKDNQVKVQESVTKEMMNLLNEDNYPTLTFTAYAIQQANIGTEGAGDAANAAAAWEEIAP